MGYEYLNILRVIFKSLLYSVHIIQLFWHPNSPLPEPLLATLFYCKYVMFSYKVCIFSSVRADESW